MKVFSTKIAEHSVRLTTESEQVCEWIRQMFGGEPTFHDDSGVAYDMKIDVQDNYGVSFVDYSVEITHTEGQVRYRRSDYQMVTNGDYSNTNLAIFDYLALKHSLITLYSAFIVKHQWGLVIHSSSVVNDGKGYIFAGRSGAGKSTTARLSAPRTLFSDEASIVKISDEGTYIFDSPFRTVIPSQFLTRPVPLQAMYLLKQSPKVERHPLKTREAIVRVMQQMFYWKHRHSETMAAWRLQRQLIQQVPVYELEFQKNNLFWEVVL